MEIHYNVGSIFAFYASFTAFLSLAKQFYHQFIPKQIRDYIDDKIKAWFSKKTILDPKIFTLIIRQTFEEHSYTHINSVYSACEVYLTDKLTASSARLEGCRKDKQEGDLVSYHLVQGEEYVEYVELDNENNNTKSVKLQWKFSCRNDKDEEIKGGRYKLFELSFDPRYKDLILGKFIPSVVVKNYNKFMEAKKEIFLYTYNGVMSSSRQWNKVSFKHPFTFDALALDPELKKSIVEDLDRFVRRREFYKKIGRAWKRGYLLYGPPGTGKSSLIAAIANYVYDLQLASIEKDSTLRNLMMSISNKSILVIEDIDCASGLSRKVALSRNNNVARPRNVACLGDGGDYGYRDSSDDSDYGSENYGVYGSIGYEYYDEDEDNYGDDKANNNGGTEAAANSQNKIELTLSGLLNFIDGLWSSCGDERIIILTTNYKERLDPALLRPGRMDLHIHMSYLRMPAFRTLAYNYLGLSDHPLFKEIEVLLERTDVSPAEAAEELIRSEDPDIALDGLVKMMKKKKRFVKMETKGKEDNVGGESVAEKEKSGSESTSHTEITEEC